MTNSSNSVAISTPLCNQDNTQSNGNISLKHTPDHPKIWKDCLQVLRKKLPQQQFNTWIVPLITVFDEGKAKLLVFTTNRFKLDWLRAQYLKSIYSALQENGNGEIKVELIVQKILSGKPVTSPPKTHQNPLAVPPPQPKRKEDKQNTSYLNTSLTFENFIEGTANRMARAASLHVASYPSSSYNPLFIYGGVGLGKTHLMQAIGNQLFAEKPTSKILYIHAERFVSDVVKAYQRKTFDQFKSLYHQLNLLLIDDVQFFANKERTQEEFFNAFEALLAKKSQIVLTSDTYPKGLDNIHERLVSRFDSGLTVAIEPPELEMRVAILLKKAELERTSISEEVAFFVAKNVRSNVRELEGALRKVLAYARFNHKPISIPLAKEALRDLLLIQNQQISVENIQTTVAEYYKIKVSDIYSKKRPANIAKPRQIAMYLAKELTQKSLPEIGDLFGGRDHTTVLHAVRKITNERKQLTELNQQLHILEQTLKS